MKKFALLMLMAVLVLGLIASVVVARGPANRATGSVWLDHENDGQNRYVEFDAHVGKDGRPAKGTIYWYQWTGTQEWYDTSPVHVVEVKYVEVDGNTAWFAAGPGSQGWLVMKVCDLGTPASDGDEVSAVWVTTESAAEAMVNLKGSLSGNVYTYELIGGNLVVHYYE
jgi:hypothetical protein